MLLEGHHADSPRCTAILVEARFALGEGAEQLALVEPVLDDVIDRMTDACAEGTRLG